MTSSRFQKTVTSVIGFVAAIVLTSCAGSAAQEKTQKVEKPASSSDAGKQVSQGDCFAGAISLTAMREQCKIDGKGYKFTLRDMKTAATLQDVVKATGKKVAIFQLVGVTCISCQEESREIERRVAKGSYSDDIAHVLLFTDRAADEYSEKQFNDFVKAHSNNALRAHDVDGKLWLAIQPETADGAPGRSPIFAMDSEGNGAFINLEGRMMDIVAAAERLAKNANK